MDGVLRYPAALLESLLWSRCKLWGWEGIAFWDNATAFFSCFGVGGLTWLDVAQQLKQIFFGEAYEESFLCVHCFILFACLLLFFLTSYINQHLWELWFPPLPHAYLEESLQAVISKAGLGYFWECHSLVIHWKVKVFVWSQDGLETGRALPGQVWLSAFGYKWT